jgi:acyl-CoA thioesterase I
MQRLCLMILAHRLLVISSVTNGVSPVMANREIRYAVIGDSYSIGEGATPEQSWPASLTRHLVSDGVDIKLVANPSVTGWTTEQAIDRELPVFREAKPNFATLHIGVNDWVQGVTAEKFRQNFSLLVDQMRSLLPDKHQLLIITIPDFSVTPEGPKFARGRNISEGIASFNRIIIEEAEKRDLAVVDIFPLSQRMGDDTAFVARDGLHPSAKAYAEWERVIYPAALELLKKSVSFGR